MHVIIKSSVFILSNVCFWCICKWWLQWHTRSTMHNMPSLQNRYLWFWWMYWNFESCLFNLHKLLIESV